MTKKITFAKLSQADNESFIAIKLIRTFKGDKANLEVRIPLSLL